MSFDKSSQKFSRQILLAFESDFFETKQPKYHACDMECLCGFISEGELSEFVDEDEEVSRLGGGGGGGKEGRPCEFHDM